LPYRSQEHPFSSAQSATKPQPFGLDWLQISAASIKVAIGGAEVKSLGVQATGVITLDNGREDGHEEGQLEGLGCGRAQQHLGDLGELLLSQERCLGLHGQSALVTSTSIC
jgi:hypothetical protein